MEQNGIERILSFNSGFDAFPRITRRTVCSFNQTFISVAVQVTAHAAPPCRLPPAPDLLHRAERRRLAELRRGDRLRHIGQGFLQNLGIGNKTLTWPGWFVDWVSFDLATSPSLPHLSKALQSAQVILFLDPAFHSIFGQDRHHLAHGDSGKFSSSTKRRFPFLVSFLPPAASCPA